MALGALPPGPSARPDVGPLPEGATSAWMYRSPDGTVAQMAVDPIASKVATPGSDATRTFDARARRGATPGLLYAQCLAGHALRVDLLIHRQPGEPVPAGARGQPWLAPWVRWARGQGFGKTQRAVRVRLDGAPAGPTTFRREHHSFLASRAHWSARLPARTMDALYDDAHPLTVALQGPDVAIEVTFAPDAPARAHHARMRKDCPAALDGGATEPPPRW